MRSQPSLQSHPQLQGRHEPGCRRGDQRFGIAHRVFQRHRPVDDRHDGGEALGPEVLRVAFDQPGKGHGRHAGRPGAAGDADGHLAGQRLGVQPALAGDDEVGAGDRRVQPGQLRNQRKARPHLASGSRAQQKADAAGCPGPRGLAMVDAGRRDGDFGEVRHAGLEDRNVRVRHALLRAEDMHRALRPEERAGDVGGDRQLPSAQPRIEAVEIDRRDPAQHAARASQHIAVGIQEPSAEGGQQAGAAIDRGAAADAQKDALGSAIQCVADQHAGAEGRGAGRVGAVAEQRQPGGGGHFDDGEAAVGDPAIGGVDRPVERVGHGAADVLAAETGDQGLDRALAAVGHGQQHRFDGPVDPAEAVGDGRRHGRRRGRALERIGSNQDAHGKPIWGGLG